MQADNVQSVVQVLAKLSIADCLFQVAPGGGNDPHIHAERLPPAQAFQSVLLQDAQKFRLRARRQLTDLIQEDRSCWTLARTGPSAADALQ